MLKIHDVNPTAIFDLIDLSVIDEWDSLPEGKLTAILFGPEVDKTSLHDDICRRIFTTAAEITKAQQTAVVGPRPHMHAKPDATPPYTFLIYKLIRNPALHTFRMISLVVGRNHIPNDSAPSN